MRRKVAKPLVSKARRQQLQVEDWVLGELARKAPSGIQLSHLLAESAMPGVTASSGFPVGRAFAEAPLVQVWRQLKALIADDINFRGPLLRRTWEASSAKELVNRAFAEFFEPTDDIYVTSSISNEAITERQSVVCRFRVRMPKIMTYACRPTTTTGSMKGSASTESSTQVFCPAGNSNRY